MPLPFRATARDLLGRQPLAPSAYIREHTVNSPAAQACLPSLFAARGTLGETLSSSCQRDSEPFPDARLRERRCRIFARLQRSRHPVRLGQSSPAKIVPGRARRRCRRYDSIDSAQTPPTLAPSFISRPSACCFDAHSAGTRACHRRAAKHDRHGPCSSAIGGSYRLAAGASVVHGFATGCVRGQRLPRPCCPQPFNKQRRKGKSVSLCLAQSLTATYGGQVNADGPLNVKSVAQWNALERQCLAADETAPNSRDRLGLSLFQSLWHYGYREDCEGEHFLDRIL
jgi:hypothetical protein